jgi:hypothetical protein
MVQIHSPRPFFISRTFEDQIERFSVSYALPVFVDPLDEDFADLGIRRNLGVRRRLDYCALDQKQISPVPKQGQSLSVWPPLKRLYFIDLTLIRPLAP